MCSERGVHLRTAGVDAALREECFGWGKSPSYRASLKKGAIPLGLYLVWFVLIGLLAGYIAGRLTQGSGFGVLGDLVIGILGAFLGGFLFRLLGIEAYSLIGQLIMAVIGAIVLLKLIAYVHRKGV
jgi:uncharacterized membrane protein YeaQ/YmgE (transglycosylase-associated protein family)